VLLVGGGRAEAANMSERETKIPYAVLQRIIDENPNADPSVWRAQFLREVMDDPDLQRAVVDKVLTDMFDDLRQSRHRVISSDVDGRFN
jgi:hypothetical protein